MRARGATPCAPTRIYATNVDFYPINRLDMKKRDLKQELALSEIADSMLSATSDWRRFKAAIVIFFGLCLNLILATRVYGATTGAIEKGTAYAIAFLILLTLALSIYLFAVILQPERF
jgi:K+-transporting ATPase KdpF subunit